MTYGKEGTEYTLNGHELFINEKFLASTLFATILVLEDIIGEEGINNAIESVANALYLQIKETESGGTGSDVKDAGKPVD
jgi:uncharacterized protein (DUF608 family)